MLSGPALFTELGRQHGVPVVRPAVLALVPRELVTSRRNLPIAHASR